MANLTNFAENKLVNNFLNNSPLNFPANWHIALFTSNPTETGAAGTEVAGNGYARVAVTRNTTEFPATSNDLCTNANTISFPSPTANWGTISHIGIFDAAAGGNCWLFAELSAAQVINTGVVFSFQPNSLTLIFN